MLALERARGEAEAAMRRAYDGGMSIRDIAAVVGLSKSEVHRILQRPA